MDFPEVTVGYMRIDLRCRDIGMAEHGLYRAQIRAVLEEISRERVANDVRRHFACDAGFGGVVLHDSFYTTRTYSKALLARHSLGNGWGWLEGKREVGSD